MNALPPTGPRRHTAPRAPLTLALGTMLLACAACPWAPAEPTAPATSGQPQPQASTLWRDVFGGLARRADHGDAESARLALEMHRIAPLVYGEPLPATPAQLRAWRCRAARLDAPCPSTAPLA